MHFGAGMAQLGIYNEFYTNGILNIEAIYRNGKLHGEYIEYDQAGKPMKVCNYYNGVLHGDYYEYLNGVMTMRTTYSMGRMAGMIEKFYNNGHIKSKHSTIPAYDGAYCVLQ